MVWKKGGGCEIADRKRHSAAMGWNFIDHWVVLACSGASILVPVFVNQVQVAVEEFSRYVRLGSPHHVVIAASDYPQAHLSHAKALTCPTLVWSFLVMMMLTIRRCKN